MKCNRVWIRVDSVECGQARGDGIHGGFWIPYFFDSSIFPIRKQKIYNENELEIRFTEGGALDVVGTFLHIIIDKDDTSMVLRKTLNIDQNDV